MLAQGHMLTELRKTHRLSQLELGLAAEVSARHISFIETGRTQPSRELLMRLAGVMGLSHRETNLLLTACGYSAAFSRLSLDEAQMQPVNRALTIMLDNHDPFPATVLSADWEVRMANTSMQRLLGLLLGTAPADGPVNMLKLLFDRDGLRPFILNWDELAALLLRRLRLELHTRPLPESAELFEALLQMDPPAHWRAPPMQWEGPMLTAKVRVREHTLSLFTTLSSFGTPLDTGLQELSIESYFPGDNATHRFFTEQLPTLAHAQMHDGHHS